MVKPNLDRRREALALKLTGLSYKAVGVRLGVSAARAQQLLRPPKEIAAMVKDRARGCCERCGILVARGDIHHTAKHGSDPDTYEAPEALVYLCPSCHQSAHALDRRNGAPQLPTVNLGLRVPPGVRDQLGALAMQRHESLNATCAAILAHYVSKYPAKEGQ